MGSEACADELMNEENSVSLTSKAADESCEKIVEVKDMTLASQSSDGLKEESSIGPVTPDSKRENGEQNQDFASPLTVVLPSPPQSPLSNSSDGYPLEETPKGALYNSFAPGPDSLMQAPKHRKQGEDSRLVVKRLSCPCAINLVNRFSETSIETMSDEDHLFEIIHSAILDDIYLEHARSHISDSETPQTPKSARPYVSDSERPRTPNSARILSRASEMVPGAPMKSKRKVMKIDQELCRKLEF